MSVPRYRDHAGSRPVLTTTLIISLLAAILLTTSHVHHTSHRQSMKLRPKGSCDGLVYDTPTLGAWALLETHHQSYFGSVNHFCYTMCNAATSHYEDMCANDVLYGRCFEALSQFSQRSKDDRSGIEQEVASFRTTYGRSTVHPPKTEAAATARLHGMKRCRRAFTIYPEHLHRRSLDGNAAFVSSFPAACGLYHRRDGE